MGAYQFTDKAPENLRGLKVKGSNGFYCLQQKGRPQIFRKKEINQLIQIGYLEKL